MSLKIWLPLNGNIENQGTLNTTSRLPSGYTEVEYIENTTTQFIDTGFTATNGMKAVFCFRGPTYTKQACILGSHNYQDSTNGYNRNQFLVGGTSFYGNVLNSYNNILDGYEANKWFTVEFSSSKTLGLYYTVNGIKKDIASDPLTLTPNSTVLLLRSGYDNSICPNTYIKSVILYNYQGSLVRNLIPALRNSDNKPGMYDTVTGTFYTNAGSGEFSVGPAVTCSITNNGATIDNNGKIGKCYSFNGGTITAPAPRVTNKITVAAWIKAPDNNSGWRRVCGMQSTSISWQSASALLMLNGTNLYFSISNGSTCTSGGCVFDIGDSSNWFHACGTYDGTTARLYVNGVLKKEVAITTTIENTPVWLGGTSAGERFTGKLNDFRLYDECLSADQIKEISRGMVLHYKMCQPERSENLYVYNSISTGGFGLLDVPYPSFSHNSVTRTTTITNNGGGALRISNLGLNGYSGHLTISFYAWASKACSFSLDCCDYSCTSSINLTTVKKKFVVNTNHVTDRFNTSNNYNGFIDWNFSNTSGAIIYIQDLKVEKGENPNPQWSPAPSDNQNWGTIEYDGSGYKNHSSHPSNSMPVFVSDSPRYTGSYKFIGNNSQLNIPITKMSGYTICFWRKGTATERWLPLGDNGSNKWLGAAEVSGSYSTIYHNGCSCEICYVDGVAATVYPRDNNWHFYCYTNVTLDWDGVWIHGYNGYRPTDYWSDFRIYSTALDATDVAELYKLGK